MRRTAWWVIAAATVLRAMVVDAQVHATVWDEARIRRRAVQSAPAVRAARARVEAARALRAYARVPVVGNPTVGIRALIGVPDASAATYSLLLGLPIDVSGQRAAWGREADHAIAQAEADLDAARNDAIAAARRAWIEAGIADARSDVADARVDAAREGLAGTRARVAARASTALDLSLAERELGEAEADAARARAATAQARASLREALDLAADDAVPLAVLPAPTLPSALTARRAADRALGHRAEPRALFEQAARWNASGQRARAAAIAPLLVAAEVEAQGNESQARSIGASMQWALPFVQTAQGDRAAARGEALVATTRAQTTMRAIAREGAAAFVELGGRLDELGALDTTAMPAAERTVALTADLFDAGAIDTFRVLQVRRELYSLRVRRLDALRDAWLARIALDRALGEEIR